MSLLQIGMFRKWQGIAAAEDADLYLYPRIIWKFSKTDEDLKVIGFIERMKADAEQNGIYLDLKKLFALDLAHIERTAQVFIDARQTAEACGIDLKLPELLLKEARRCDFVEEGGMFVSWDGEVFPCYFLWHHYHCFASGWRQAVKPRSFGNLTATSALEIWNTGAFKAFRENVLRTGRAARPAVHSRPEDDRVADDRRGGHDARHRRARDALSAAARRRSVIARRSARGPRGADSVP